MSDDDKEAQVDDEIDDAGDQFAATRNSLEKVRYLAFAPNPMGIDLRFRHIHETKACETGRRHAKLPRDGAPETPNPKPQSQREKIPRNGEMPSSVSHGLVSSI